MLHQPLLPTLHGMQAAQSRSGGSAAEGMSQEETEHVLCLLTAPRIRLPLMLGWLATERISLTLHLGVQAIVRACLFEPGDWLSEQDEAATTIATIPATDAGVLGCSEGLLLTEMWHCPHAVAEPIGRFHQHLHTYMPAPPAARGLNPLHPLIQFARQV